MSIEWKTFEETVRHRRAEVTEENVLEFAREHGWTISYVEKKVPPHPDGRAMVLQVGMDAYRDRPIEVPFWVEESYDGKLRQAGKPYPNWKEVPGD